MSVQQNALEELLKSVVFLTGAKLNAEVIAQSETLQCHYVTHNVLERLAVTVSQDLADQGRIISRVANQL